ncbi:MAG: hypothetical protein AAGA30_08625 [Planctomycetota bacterium]
MSHEQKNIYQRVLAEDNTKDVIADGATLDLTTLKASIELNDQEKIIFQEKAAKSICATGNGNILHDGIWLLLVHAITITSGMFGKFLLVVGLNKTQAYRRMNVAKHTAARFADAPELLEQFVPEGLKIVGQPGYPEPARDEVFVLASKGTLIDIATANSIGQRHERLIAKAIERDSVAKPRKLVANCQKANPGSVQPKKTSSVKPFHRFGGKFVQFVLRSKVEGSVPKLDLVIADVLKLLAELETLQAIQAGVKRPVLTEVKS